MDYHHHEGLIFISKTLAVWYYTGMRLQSFKLENKNGEIHKVNGKYEFRTNKKTTIYDSLKELIQVERRLDGEQSTKPKKTRKRRTKKTKVLEATDSQDS